MQTIDIEDAVDDDRKFFERRKRRQHRVRFAYQSEVLQFKAMAAAEGDLERVPDEGLLIAVKQIAPGYRLRKPFVNLWEGAHPTKDDLRRMSERDTKSIFEMISP